jgi:hypothetical protein
LDDLGDLAPLPLGRVRPPEEQDAARPVLLAVEEAKSDGTDTGRPPNSRATRRKRGSTTRGAIPDPRWLLSPSSVLTAVNRIPSAGQPARMAEKTCSGRSIRSPRTCVFPVEASTVAGPRAATVVWSW